MNWVDDLFRHSLSHHWSPAFANQATDDDRCSEWQSRLGAPLVLSSVGPGATVPRERRAGLGQIQGCTWNLDLWKTPQPQPSGFQVPVCINLGLPEA